MNLREMRRFSPAGIQLFGAPPSTRIFFSR